MATAYIPFDVRPRSPWRPISLSLTVDSILVQEPNLAASEIDGCVVVLSLRAGSYFDFNRVATEIWRMLSEPCPISRILQSLSQQHDGDSETLARDTMGFLQTLIEQRLVRVLLVGEL